MEKVLNQAELLAEAILEYAQGQKVQPAKVEQFRAIPGRGVQGKIDGVQYYAGNQRLMEEKKIDTSSVESRLGELADEGKTPMLFADEKQVLGIISVADVVKPTSREAVRQFKELGIEVVMLTGDDRRTAEAIRRQLDIDAEIAEVLPQDKESEISQLQVEGRCVAMIGDGVNDAPALARADVGIAMGGVGSDIAIEAADIALVNDEISELPHLLRLSRRMMRTIKLNLTFSMALNFAAIVLAMTGLLGPVVGALVHNAGSVLVIINSAFLLRWRKRGA